MLATYANSAESNSQVAAPATTYCRAVPCCAVAMSQPAELRSTESGPKADGMMRVESVIVVPLAPDDGDKVTKGQPGREATEVARKTGEGPAKGGFQ